MILPVFRLVRDRVSATVARLYDLPADDPALAEMSIEIPPRRALGDIAVPVAFALARRLRKAPRVTAQEIAAALGTIDGVARVDVAPNGYLNLFLDRPFWVRRWTGEFRPTAEAAQGEKDGKTIVEHTAINPNKAAHIGHLRNAALGDAFGRLLRFQGRQVEIQNYIDDTGVQVADVVVGFRELEGKSLDEVRALADAARFDYYCWDLYARGTEWYGNDKEKLKTRAAMLHDIEHGVEPNAGIAAFIADTIVRCHLKTMARLNIDYQLLTWEGDILRLKFWARAFEAMKATGAVYLQNEGKHAGCWVMKIDDPDTAPDPEEEDDPESREKVIVRSNGTAVYVAKDMAYQFWKSGLLGHDFQYRKFATRMNGEPLWATTSDASLAVTDHPKFGAAAATYNVIDVRQSYLQKLLKQALTAIGHATEAERLTHFSYEMVALSHATAKELGFAPAEGSEEAKKPFVEVSGRKGLGVKADDLIDLLIDKAKVEVDKREPDATDAERRQIAGMIGVAAVRYFLIKYSRTTVIAFDIDEALNFQGESGPYLQYSVVRANNIFQKLQDRLGLDEASLLSTLPKAPTAAIDGSDGDHELWALVLEASRLDEVVEQVIRSLEFAVLAKYGFGLAQLFNAFYHRAQILNEDRDDVRRWRAAAVAYFRTQLTKVLDLMGVSVPPRM